MKTQILGIVAVLSIAIGPLSVAVAPRAAAQEVAQPAITSVAASLVNLTEGDAVVFQRAPNALRAPASLTKVVTALVARDEYRLEEIVQTTDAVLQTHGSDLGLEPGMELTVRDLLYALLLKSGNDAAMALATHHPVGYRYFVQLMNEKARSIGALDSNFHNPHGLDQVGHFSTVRDMAVIAREFAADELLLAMAGTKEHTIGWTDGETLTMTNHHRLVLDDDEVIAGKTGFTNNAGHCLISLAQTSAGMFAVVVFGSQNHYADTRALIDHGKAFTTQVAAGGGALDRYGRLRARPDAPDVGLASIGALASDPRDDVRWTILLGVLALLTAAAIVWQRRDGGSELEAWLDRLARD